MRSRIRSGMTDVKSEMTQKLPELKSERSILVQECHDSVNIGYREGHLLT